MSAGLAAAEPFLVAEGLLVITAVSARFATSRVEQKAEERAAGASLRAEESPSATAAMAAWAVDIAQSVNVGVAPIVALAALRPPLGESGPYIYFGAAVFAAVLAWWVWNRPNPTRYAAQRLLGLGPVDWSALVLNAAAASLAWATA